MASITGVVNSIGVKRSKNDGTPLKTPLYSLQINGQWFNCGFTNPNVSEGETIHLTYVTAQYGNEVTKGSIEVVQKAGDVPKTGGLAVASGDRNSSIVYQSSRKDALKFAELAVVTGCLTLPKTKAGQLEALEAFVELYTDKFAYAALSPIIVEPVSSPVVDMVNTDE